jgi:hypothetical protein
LMSTRPPASIDSGICTSATLERLGDAHDCGRSIQVGLDKSIARFDYVGFVIEWLSTVYRRGYAVWTRFWHVHERSRPRSIACGRQHLTWCISRHAVSSHCCPSLARLCLPEVSPCACTLFQIRARRLLANDAHTRLHVPEVLLRSWICVCS